MSSVDLKNLSIKELQNLLNKNIMKIRHLEMIKKKNLFKYIKSYKNKMKN